MSQDKITVFRKLAAEPDPAFIRRKKLFKQGFAVCQRHLPQVKAVKMQQIEQIKNQTVTAPVAQIGLKRRKT